MRDKTIRCICTNDDAIECLRERYGGFYNPLVVFEGEACPCLCHDYMQDEEEAMSDWDDHLMASDGQIMTGKPGSLDL